MSRRLWIAVVVAALLIAAPAAALASGEDAQAETKKPAETAEKAEAKDEAKDEAKKELADAKFNTLEDLFALLAAPTLTVADTSIESGKATIDDVPSASGVTWTRVDTTEPSD